MNGANANMARLPSPGMPSRSIAVPNDKMTNNVLCYLLFAIQYSTELVPFCGRTFRVLKRVTKILGEATGRMTDQNRLFAWVRGAFRSDVTDSNILRK
jgi:hypothetical protein